ncbi:hypothetical protein DK926_07440 [Rhodococcus sp. Eu-32]|uniref:DNA alkylation repair protein n=1 Tax=Rhodococcus sp. Eu-32 TaxID=1017319 RepID=UPI000DF17EA5|nr:DNA alkylation repair protein [Rhodococcus sp. Eu-32]RRQ28661.1 hypothetical protein DK926_07440 [Rhodococcus sp. Eu-32]
MCEKIDPIAKRVDRSQVVGVRMKRVFDLAKANAHLDLETVRDLLRSRWFESRMVAVSILDARARRKAPRRSRVKASVRRPRCTSCPDQRISAERRTQHRQSTSSPLMYNDFRSLGRG